MRRTLAESPSGLVHIVQLFERGAVTECGRRIDRSTWTRIRQFDAAMQGKMPSTIHAMVELPTCDRCFKR